MTHYYKINDRRPHKTDVRYGCVRMSRLTSRKTLMQFHRYDIIVDFKASGIQECIQGRLYKNGGRP